MGETGEALKAFQESLRLAEEVGSKKAIANAQGNLGTIYSRMGRPTEALQSYEQAIKLFEQLGAREAIGIAYFEIAQVYFNLNKPEESKLSLEKALQVGRQVQNKDVISKSYRLLSQIDSSAADYVSALEHYKLYITYRDSISNAEAAKNLIEQRMEYSFSKKEDSLRLQQALIAEQLDKQTLLTKQQQQELRLKQASLELARREKDVQMLSFLKTQAELQLSNEQKEKELTLAEQQRALQQAQLEKQTLLSTQKEQSLLLKDKELSAQRSQRNFWIGGAIALFLLSFFIFLNYRNQRNANSRLQHQQARTERALTELKSAQAQLIQSEKMASLGELTAGIAHEIQNPLNFVNNFAELNDEMVDEMNHELLSGKFDDAVALGKVIKENNSKINHHGKRADAIVKGMLQHSRPASTMKEPTDINKLADEYLRLSYHGLRAKDKDFYANLASDFDEHIGNIEIVPQDIGRVLLNLYNNAFYAVNEKKKQMDGRFEPTVSVTIKNSGAKVEISVRDNGTGIPQKALDKIYHPFFTTKPTGQGTGLGLSLSYDIIKAHGGELNVETKEGEFSEFIVRLPVRNKNSNLI
jgi:signal transduction histidine kinase